ncbi:hypothetical protein [Cryptosporangium sp. NPDC051539]|uniref:hypothetical protein n=1 Tax=Cryptosporangium sp. NPDC051539 TaxID=3363962 RepID=UPI0037BC2656
MRAAVADGASESLLAGAWARLLVRTACRYGPAALDAALRHAAEVWSDDVREHFADGPVPWWQQEKLRRGAQATMLVVEAGPDDRWGAAAVGDSCVLHCRNGTILAGFPLSSATDFDVRPDLVVSTAVDAVRPVSIAGRFDRGDQLILVTDALAAWAFRLHEEGGSPVPVLLDLTADAERLDDWAAGQQAAGRLRNDDLTLLVVAL